MSRVVVLLTVLALSIQADAISNIVAFGDSLTDDCTHGASALVDSVLDTNQPYPGAPYYNGCIFSSGPPYSQVAAGLLNATLTDYAIGGATSGAIPGYLEVSASFANNSSPALVEAPSSLEQVANYLDTTNGIASPEDLYLVFIGANDYLDTLAGEANATVEEVLTATAEAMDVLYQAGARVFFTQTLPYLGETPALTSQGAQAVAIANEITTGHNEALAELIPVFAADHLEASVILFNFEAFLVDLAANASALGITDTTTPCYTGAVAGTATTAANTSAVCSNSNTHAYWDSVHPTGIVHQLWGQAVAEQLMPLFTTSASGRKLLSEEHAGIASGAISVYGQPL